MNLPNAITTFRILLAPVTTLLIMQSTTTGRVVAMVVFLVAALSDLVDGELARRRGQITDFGKLVDPLADKLLVVATIVPFYLLTRWHPELGRLPLFDGIAWWVLAIIFGREIVVTWLRSRAARRGVVVPAMRSGKYKAFAQNVFIGAMILWLAYRTDVTTGGERYPLGRGWDAFHGWFTTLSLAIALGLTVVSFFVYLRVFRSAEPGAATP